MIVTIHQPEHLPWLGFFDKLRQADVLVMLDHVQYRKNYYQNRNKIRSDRGSTWLTVPVLTKGESAQPINEVQIDNRSSPRWRERCWTSIQQHYRKAKYWKDHEEFFQGLYKTDWARLVDMNDTIIRYMLASLSIEVKVINSSQMSVDGQRTALLLNTCRELGADVYLSGVSGKDYLDLDMFVDVGIDVRFQEFHHPIYKQVYDPFIPCMSAIDLLFNYGPDTLDVIKGVGVETMDHIFK